ncbi:Nif3-like dinuclear metal center hexameric protein [Mycoplasma sp. 744]|uniref:Nif3-like dinuclear metal center hexameric protein n=1 Tax=Mycoplasma sp. 744 TaxID=3108531 RepID=UPI002B1E214F|nr:Nif3-like dinuclear metal center hexameric protein [Mycoplasma sp. 744]MEA4115525.1 Nif3-like dinuclear metal center hexameric protein [Mycoplasma sp. 744]
MQIRKLTNYLLNLYPLENKEIWDPSGFSVKFNLSEKLNGVVSSIDLTKEVLEKALEINANLILVHHPFKFYETWEDEFLHAPYKKEILNKLKDKRINVLALHTNFDSAAFGTSKRIAAQLGLSNQIINNDDKYAAVLETSIKMNDLISLIKNELNLHSFRTNLKNNYNDLLLKKIVILSGSGYIVDVNKHFYQGADLIITSDIKWSDWINYQQLKVPILEIPHLDEQVFAITLNNQINQFSKNKQTNFKNIIHLLDQPYKNI